MTEHVRRELTGGIMTLTITRPDKKNALSEAMYAALSDGLELAERDPTVRVILLQGDGDSFTAGNDLAPFAMHRMARISPVRFFVSSAISAALLSR